MCNDYTKGVENDDCCDIIYKHNANHGKRYCARNVLVVHSSGGGL